jgi:hypothetical protein
MRERRGDQALAPAAKARFTPLPQPGPVARWSVYRERGAVKREPNARARYETAIASGPVQPNWAFAGSRRFVS